MATKFLVNAINGKEKSQPFVMYCTADVDELDKKFVLRLDDAEDREGSKVIRISNANVGLIVSHQPEYAEKVLTGFRRKVEDVVCIVCERFRDDIPSMKAITNAKEVF